ncbi:hypothetical protein CMK19_04695 [Candidatus Poribacteria bacterium]|nr:hypothetical protein [Candidatus Poribacteria bacterium]MEE2911007.1 sigma-54 dependent transcriptional regulator [Candidatus Poribacteria bacterium]|tara:strand:+ start:2351 stop:3712 length:1362 start_codon:yes stop_codon:yes gene_type:complete
MSDCQILIVDDEDFMRGAVLEVLRRANHVAMTASSAKEAIDIVSNRSFSVIITDVKMPGMNGVELFRELKKRHPETSVIIMTGFPDLEDAVEVIKEGAVDYLQKPFPPDRLVELVNQFIEVPDNRGDDNLKNIITQDEQMLRILDKIRTVAPSNAPVLVQGETGTGKELIAQALHNLSFRTKSGQMVALNCAAIPENLLESEMFGAEKGAYTGSNLQYIGRFERANKGTLFLDEISELSLPLQSKLLRALQEREIERLGGTQPIKVDVRIVACTNENIQQTVDQGKFRSDLFYRLDVIRIVLPPLRQRPSDISLLAEHFLQKYNQEYDKSISGIEPEVLPVLAQYSWPGNIRQLENTIQAAVIQTKADYITVDDIDMRQDNSFSPIETEIVKNEGDQINFQVGMTLRDLEKEAIMKTLEAHDYNQTKTAETLDITSRTIRNKLKDYDNQDTTE